MITNGNPSMIVGVTKTERKSKITRYYRDTNEPGVFALREIR